MQQNGYAPGALDGIPARARGNQAKVALVLSAIGVVLCGAGLAAAIATIALPRSDFLTSYFGIALTACGAVGLWPGIAGLALGVMALVALRKRGEPHRVAWWAAVLGGAGPVAVGLSFFALWLNARLV
jgi:hypothetical protein